MPTSAEPDLLSPGEVAGLFGVDRKTVRRWADTGKLPTVRTLGGHRRFPAAAIRAALDDGAISLDP